jgi:hypothetical protein
MKTIEGLADAALLILVTVPVALMLVMSPFCGGWNEGTMSGTCTIPLFEGVYNTLNGFLLVIGFGGIIVYGPIVLMALVISIVTKVGGYARGHRWTTMQERVQLLLAIVPLLVVLYFIFILFGFDIFLFLFGW